MSEPDTSVFVGKGSTRGRDEVRTNTTPPTDSESLRLTPGIRRLRRHVPSPSTPTFGLRTGKRGGRGLADVRRDAVVPVAPVPGRRPDGPRVHTPGLRRRPSRDTTRDPSGLERGTGSTLRPYSHTLGPSPLHHWPSSTPRLPDPQPRSPTVPIYPVGGGIRVRGPKVTTVTRTDVRRPKKVDSWWKRRQVR